jgi:hypothetical protein
VKVSYKDEPNVVTDLNVLDTSVRGPHRFLLLCIHFCAYPPPTAVTNVSKAVYLRNLIPKLGTVLLQDSLLIRKMCNMYGSTKKAYTVSVGNLKRGVHLGDQGVAACNKTDVKDTRILCDGV